MAGIISSGLPCIAKISCNTWLILFADDDNYSANRWKLIKTTQVQTNSLSCAFEWVHKHWNNSFLHVFWDTFSEKYSIPLKTNETAQGRLKGIGSDANSACTITLKIQCYFWNALYLLSQASFVNFLSCMLGLLQRYIIARKNQRQCVLLQGTYKSVLFLLCVYSIRSRITGSWCKLFACQHHCKPFTRTTLFSICSPLRAFKCHVCREEGTHLFIACPFLLWIVLQ